MAIHLVVPGIRRDPCARHLTIAPASPWNPWIRRPDVAADARWAAMTSAALGF